MDCFSSLVRHYLCSVWCFWRFNEDIKIKKRMLQEAEICSAQWESVLSTFYKFLFYHLSLLFPFGKIEKTSSKLIANNTVLLKKLSSIYLTVWRRCNYRERKSCKKARKRSEKKLNFTINLATKSKSKVSLLRKTRCWLYYAIIRGLGGELAQSNQPWFKFLMDEKGDEKEKLFLWWT